MVYEEATPTGLFLCRIDATDGSGDRRLGTGRMPGAGPGGERVAFADGPDVFTILGRRRRPLHCTPEEQFVRGIDWQPR